MDLGTTFESWFSLKGLNILVTGAGSGLAEPVAVAFAEAGAQVAVGHHEAAEAERVTNLITARGGQAFPLALDVTDEGSVLAAFAEVRSRMDHLDGLFNGAMRQGGCPLTEMTAAQWDQMHDINLRGAFLCCREAVKMMVAGGRGGRILALSTIGSLHPVLHYNVAYGPSKAGLNTLMRNIAHDYAAQGIRANAILPGAIPGNAAKLDGAAPATGPGQDPARRPFGLGPVHEVARMAVYLAGPSASYISGQNIVIDGGFSAL